MATDEENAETGTDEASAAEFRKWQTAQIDEFRRRRRDAEDRLGAWMPKLCAGGFGATLFLANSLTERPEGGELIAAAWACWVAGLAAWYGSGLTAIRADDTVVTRIENMKPGDEWAGRGIFGVCCETLSSSAHTGGVTAKQAATGCRQRGVWIGWAVRAAPFYGPSPRRVIRGVRLNRARRLGLRRASRAA